MCCKPDVLKPDVLKPDLLKPDVLKPDVLWVYQINTCRKVPLQVNFLDNDIWHCFLVV
jgi:hypothetical protein